MNDHYYELRLDGMKPERFRTLQGAMAKAVLAQPISGGIWQVIDKGDVPVQIVQYDGDGGVDALAPLE